MKVRTFAFANKPMKVKTGTEKELTLNADRELFSRLLIAARKRKVSLQELFCYELSAVPLSLFTPDGSYRKTDKSKLLHELEQTIIYAIVEELPDAILSTAQVFDAMEIIQVQKLTANQTFGSYAKGFSDTVLRPFSTLQGCTRVSGCSIR